MAISCQSETPCGLKKRPAQAVGAGQLNWWRPAVSVVARSKRRQDYSMGKAQHTKRVPFYLPPFRKTAPFHSTEECINLLRRSRIRLVSRSRLKPISPDISEPIRILTFAAASWL